MTFAWLQPFSGSLFPTPVFSAPHIPRLKKNLILAELRICPTASPSSEVADAHTLKTECLACWEAFSYLCALSKQWGCILLKTLWTKYTVYPVILIFPSRDTSWWRITTLGEKIHALRESFFMMGPWCHLCLHLPLLASSPHPLCPHQLLVLVIVNHQRLTHSPVLFLASILLHRQFSLSESTLIACLQSTRHYVKRFTCFNSAIRIIL